MEEDMRREIEEVLPHVKRLITDRELCEAWGCSPVTTWRLRKQGELEYCRVAGSVRYTAEAVQRYLDRNQAKGGSPKGKR
jgi:hypothetical protein